MDATLIVLGAAIVLIIFQIVYTLVKRKHDAELVNAINSIKPVIYETKSTVDRTWHLHDHYDTDGLPSWYVPRSWSATQDKMIQTQEKMLEICREIANTQKTIADTLERIEKEKHEKN